MTRLIAEIRQGRMRGQKAVVDPGGTLVVGRAAGADLVVGHDRQMSAMHFALSWDGRRATVMDRGSAGGTLLDGEPITTAELVHGAWIRAGHTDLTVSLEGCSPRPRGAPSPLPRPQRARVIAALHAEGAPVYGLLDAARDDRILVLLREAVETSLCLYDGPRADALTDVAPYLVRFRADSRLLDHVVEEGWGRRWGVFCTSALDPEQVRRHWRRFLMARREDTTEELYFRFYDPWVMRVFLSACSEREREQLLRGMRALLFEAPDGTVVRCAPAATDS